MRLLRYYGAPALLAAAGWLLWHAEVRPWLGSADAIRPLRGLRSKIIVGSYTVRVYGDYLMPWHWDEYPDDQCYIQHGSQVVRVESEVGHRLDTSVEQPADGYPPRLFIEERSGATAAGIFVYSLGRSLRQIAHFGGATRFLRLEDLDGDGIHEVVNQNPHLGGTAILRYRKGQYRLAPELMRKPAPAKAWLENHAREIRVGWHQDYLASEALYVDMVEMVYTGHAHLADRFLDMAWPRGKRGRERFRSEFWRDMAQRDYWVDIRAMNGM